MIGSCILNPIKKTTTPITKIVELELNPIIKYEIAKRIIPASKISLNFPFFFFYIEAGPIATISKIIAGR